MAKDPIEALLKVFLYDEGESWKAFQRAYIKNMEESTHDLYESLKDSGIYYASNDFIQPDYTEPLIVEANETAGFAVIEAEDDETLVVNSINVSAPSLPAGVTATLNVLIDGNRLFEEDIEWTSAVFIDIVGLLGREIMCKKVEVVAQIDVPQTADFMIGEVSFVLRKAKIGGVL